MKYRVETIQKMTKRRQIKDKNDGRTFHWVIRMMESNLMGYKNDEIASHWDLRMMEEQVIGLLE